MIDGPRRSSRAGGAGALKGDFNTPIMGSPPPAPARIFDAGRGAVSTLRDDPSKPSIRSLDGRRGVLGPDGIDTPAAWASISTRMARRLRPRVRIAGAGGRTPGSRSRRLPQDASKSWIRAVDRRVVDSMEHLRIHRRRLFPSRAPDEPTSCGHPTRPQNHAPMPSRLISRLHFEIMESRRTICLRDREASDKLGRGLGPKKMQAAHTNGEFLSKTR